MTTYPQRPRVSFVAAILMMALALAACATAPEQTVVVSKAESLPPIKIPVLVPCVSASEVPLIPATNMNPAQTPEQLAAAARADLDDLEAYALRADALLRNCVKETP